MMKDGDRTEFYIHGGDQDGTKPPVEKEENDEDNPRSSICCLQGCLAATAVGFSFLVALPTGILLVVYASNKDDVPLISVGVVLISLPIIMLIVVIVLCFNQRRLARLGKNRVTSASKRKQLEASTSSPPTTTTTTTVTIPTATVTTECESGKESAVEDSCTGAELKKERY